MVNKSLVKVHLEISSLKVLDVKISRVAIFNQPWIEDYSLEDVGKSDKQGQPTSDMSPK